METLDAILSGAGIVLGLMALVVGCFGVYMEGGDRTKHGLGLAVLFVVLGTALLIIDTGAITSGLSR
jgi:hypothetical protein